MLRFVLLFNLILCPLVISKRKSHKDSSASAGDLGGRLVSALRNDVNIDLPVDEEYEDLRAELLAYHTALASLTSGRRSMKTTPCWKLGGICVDHKLCEGHRSLSEVAGCRDKLEVCCFTWNNFNVRDMRDKGIGVPAMPWSHKEEFGGKGVIDPDDMKKKKSKKKSKQKQENLYYESSHYDNKRHELQVHDNPHHDKHHEKEHNDNNDHEKNHHEKPHRENPPIVVILRTKRRNRSQ